MEKSTDCGTQKAPIGLWFDRNEILVELQGGKHSDPMRETIIRDRILQDWITLNDELRESNAESIKLGAELAQTRTELAALREENRWIPCAERLPEEGNANDEKLVYDPYNGVYTAYYRGAWWANRDTERCGIEYDNVTHWRPLPAGPEVDNA